MKRVPSYSLMESVGAIVTSGLYKPFLAKLRADGEKLVRRNNQLAGISGGYGMMVGSFGITSSGLVTEDPVLTTCNSVHNDLIDEAYEFIKEHQEVEQELQMMKMLFFRASTYSHAIENFRLVKYLLPTSLHTFWDELNVSPVSDNPFTDGEVMAFQQENKKYIDLILRRRTLALLLR